MARIPDETVERIKQETSLLRLVEAKGIALKKQGKDYLILPRNHVHFVKHVLPQMPSG